MNTHIRMRENSHPRRTMPTLTAPFVSWHLATMFLLVLGIFSFISLRFDKQYQDERLLEEEGNSTIILEESITTITQQLSVDVSFEDIQRTVIFLMASWMMAVLSQLIGLPSLVGEIISGFILGPPLLDLVPYPEAMVLIGSFGLIGLLLDSGINLDIAQLRETGSRAVLMAVTGTILALAVGLGMGYANPNVSDFRTSFAVGAAFAPSSFGVASQVLSKGEILNTPMGQMIVAASIVDDILGLILLSIMEVLVKDAPKIIDYILPFLSSFGYLIVLGFVGITVVPKVVERHIQPRFPVETRDFVAFSCLWILLALYLPLLYYSRASYLTGAFLAGLSFSQLHSVHAQYNKAGPHLKIWLMRIFFAANIGFQVPIKYFTDDNVLNWGILYFIPVLSKIPLGFLLPRSKEKVPDDFPYDPYWKDFLITTLAFTCRAEFNFIVASFALTAGVFDPEQYAAIVLAILLSAIVAPLALSKTIIYYNNKMKNFLEGKHKLNRIDNTSDGTRPLFLAIQARTPVTWGIQEKFKQALESAGLIIIDHRSWHTLGLDAVNITEIFCQDKVASVRIQDAFHHSSISGSSKKLEDSPCGHRTIATIQESPSEELTAEMEDMEALNEEKQTEEAKIAIRKQIVREALVECLGPDVDESTYAIVVSQWETVFEDSTIKSNTDSSTRDDEKDRSRHAGYRFVSPPPSMQDDPEDLDRNITTPMPMDVENGLQLPGLDDINDKDNAKNAQANTTAFSRHRRQTASKVGTSSDVASNTGDVQPRLDLDLWDVDDKAHQFASEGYFMKPIDDTGTQSVVEGCTTERPPHHHRRLYSDGNHAQQHRRTHSNDTVVLDEAVLLEHDREIEATTIKDRLHGYIRPGGDVPK